MHFSDEAPDSKTGLIIGDLTSRRFSGHEGRGTGKKTTPGGREKHAFFFGSGGVFRKQTSVN